MQLVVKMCGIQNTVEAHMAWSSGANLLGVIVDSKSPQSIDLEKASYIKKVFTPFIETCLVTESDNPGKLAREGGFEIIQVHKHIELDELYELQKEFFVLNSVRLQELEEKENLFEYLQASQAVVIHAEPNLESWQKISQLKKKLESSSPFASPSQIMIAGQLDYNNVSSAIQEINPWGVDANRGLNTDNEKDPRLTYLFAESAFNAKEKLS